MEADQAVAGRLAVEADPLEALGEVSTVARVGVALLIGAQQYGQRTDRGLLLDVGLDWPVSSVRVSVRVVQTPHGPPTVHLGRPV